MIKFLIKNKNYIIFCLIVIISGFYFEPSQEKYYLHFAIENFQKKYFFVLLPIAVLGILSIVSLYVYKKTKNIKSIFIVCAFVSVQTIAALFAFQNLLLGTFLLINRKFVLNKTTKKIVVGYLAGMEKSKNNFFLYDIESKKIITEKNLINKVYNPGFNNSDTIQIEIDKGLFGINCFE